MSIKNFQSRIIIALAIIFCAACEAVIDAPTWQPELLGPLATSNLQLEDIAELSRTFPATRIVVAKELGLDDTNLPDTICNSPYVNFQSVGPIEIDYGFVQFDSVEVDSANFSIRIDNNLPLTISKDTRLLIKNSISGAVVYELILPNDISYGAETDISIIFTDVTIEPHLELYILDFGCSGAAPNSSLVSDFDHFSLWLELKFININKVYIKADQTLTISDTTSFNLEGEQPVVTTIDGWFITYVENGFPFTADFQAYFPSNTIVPLYPTRFIVESAEVDMDGYVSSPVESVDSIYMNDNRIGEILDAKKVYFQLILRSNATQQTVAENDNTLKAQIVGDLKIKVN